AMHDHGLCHAARRLHDRAQKVVEFNCASELLVERASIPSFVGDEVAPPSHAQLARTAEYVEHGITVFRPTAPHVLPENFAILFMPRVVDNGDWTDPALKSVGLADDHFVREARQLAGEQLAKLDDQMATPCGAVMADCSPLAHE